MNYQTLERTIGHSFADIALLDLAMTHPSYALDRKSTRLNSSHM